MTIVMMSSTVTLPFTSVSEAGLDPPSPSQMSLKRPVPGLMSLTRKAGTGAACATSNRAQRAPTSA